MRDDIGKLYVLELVPPIGGDRHQARFYLGWARDDLRLERRIKAHRAGEGAALTRAARLLGSQLQVVAVWPGTPDDERKIKNYKNLSKWLRRNTDTHNWTVPAWLR